MATGLMTRSQLPSLGNATGMAPGFMGAWGSAAPSLGGSSEPKSFISKRMFPGGRVVGRMVLVPSYCLSTPVPRCPQNRAWWQEVPEKGGGHGGAP